MALNPDTLTALIAQFRGSMLAQDSYDLDIAHGLNCQDCDFVLGTNSSVQVQTRRGTSLVATQSTSDGAITALGNWLFANAGVQTALAPYYAPAAGVRAWNQNSSS